MSIILFFHVARKCPLSFASIHRSVISNMFLAISAAVIKSTSEISDFCCFNSINGLPKTNSSINQYLPSQNPSSNILGVLKVDIYFFHTVLAFLFHAASFAVLSPIPGVLASFKNSFSFSNNTSPMTCLQGCSSFFTLYPRLSKYLPTSSKFNFSTVT